MPIPLHLRGVKGDECQCGRRKSVRHCTDCGSTRLYGYSQEQWVEREGLTPIKTRLFRCIACGNRFTETDRDFCNAPPVSEALALMKLKAINEARKTGEYLNPVDQRIAQALELVEKNKPTVEASTLSEVELKQAWFALRRAWIDQDIACGGKSVIKLHDFISKHLTEAKYSQQDIDKILQWQRNEEAEVETRKQAEAAQQ